MTPDWATMTASAMKVLGSSNCLKLTKDKHGIEIVRVSVMHHSCMDKLPRRIVAGTLIEL